MSDITTPNWFTPTPTTETPGSESPLNQSRYLRPGGAVDSVGLVSTGSFTSGSVTRVGLPDNYSTALGGGYVDMTGTSLTISGLVRTTNLLVTYTTNVIENYLNSVTTFAGWITINIDGSDQGISTFESELHDTIASNTGTANGWGGTISRTSIVSLAAGDHTLKLRAKTFMIDQQLTVYAAAITYLVLGS